MTTPATTPTTLIKTFDPPTADESAPAGNYVISRSFGVDDPEAMRRAEAAKRRALGQTAASGKTAETPRGEAMEAERVESRRKRGSGVKGWWATKSPDERRRIMTERMKTRWATVRRAAARPVPGTGRLLTMVQTAALLGVSRSFCTALVRRGLLKGATGDRAGLKRPARWLVPMAEVLRFMAAPPKHGVGRYTGLWLGQAAATLANSERLVIRIAHFRGKRTKLGRTVRVNLPLSNGSLTAAGAARRIVKALRA